MSKREFLMLSHEYSESKHSIASWYVSTKLDGMRCYWDGGITRGTLANQIPWANVEKDHRLTSQVIATGLWSRNAKVIHAPNWWLDELPKDIPLDGELWIGNGRFQECMSTVRKINPVDEEWREVVYCVFDMPGYMPLMDGVIDSIHHKKEMKGCFAWAIARSRLVNPYPIPFSASQHFLKGLTHKRVLVINQEKLPEIVSKAKEQLWAELEAVTLYGGEGLMLRSPQSIWTPSRTWNLLKVKKWQDAEATVIGFTWGTGKLQGLMGSLLVKGDNGKQFELSGFTNEEREIIDVDTMDRVFGSPNTRVVSGQHNRLFPVGSRITYRYRELSKEGIPLKAQYFRKKVIE